MITCWSKKIYWCHSQNEFICVSPSFNIEFVVFFSLVRMSLRLLLISFAESSCLARSNQTRCGNPLAWRLRLCQVMITLHWFWNLAFPYLVLEKAYMHRRNWRNSNELYPPLFLPGMDHCSFDIDVVCFCATAGKSVNSHVAERLGKERLTN